MLRVRFSLSTFLICSVGAVLLCGCEGVEFNWPDLQARPVRPAGKPAAPSRTVAAGTGQPRPGEVPPAKEPQPTSTYYQLVLLSTPAPADAPPGMTHIRLQHASARSAGELLSILYVPSGPTGTSDRYTLIYPVQLELAAAAKAARALDVVAVTESTTSMPAAASDPFAVGVGVLYGTKPGGSPDKQRLRSAVTALQRAGGGADQSAWRRWAANMIAGAALADRLYDYAGADREFAAAEMNTEPGSLEQMTTLYMRARALVQDGKPDAARELLTRVVGLFDRMRSTEAFDRSHKLLGEINQRASK